MNRRQWLQRSSLPGIGLMSGLTTTLWSPTAALASPASTPARVLMVSTSVARMPNGQQTGLWMSELTTPYWQFVDKGLSVSLASIAGGPPPVDSRSVDGLLGGGASVRRFKSNATAEQAFARMASLASLQGQTFDAVFFCGGHGTMWDFRSSTVRASVERHDRAGAVVAAICHASAALLDAQGADGRALLAGKRVTGYTNSEEAAVKLTAAMPFLLETELKRQGAIFEGAANFRDNSVRDGRLITGQNPASAESTAKLVLQALTERAVAQR